MPFLTNCSLSFPVERLEQEHLLVPELQRWEWIPMSCWDHGGEKFLQCLWASGMLAPCQGKLLDWVFLDTPSGLLAVLVPSFECFSLPQQGEVMQEGHQYQIRSCPLNLP